jgi:hypothetical protein
MMVDELPIHQVHDDQVTTDVRTVSVTLQHVLPSFKAKIFLVEWQVSHGHVAHCGTSQVKSNCNIKFKLS